MKKTIDFVLKAVLSLILVLPILGLVGVFPPPTQDLYNTPQAFEFIVVAFHLVLDGGLLTGGAVLGNIMLLINAYFLWQHRREYAPLLIQTS